MESGHLFDLEAGFEVKGSFAEAEKAADEISQKLGFGAEEAIQTFEPNEETGRVRVHIGPVAVKDIVEKEG